jgi:ankyrin repeat protein
VWIICLNPSWQDLFPSSDSSRVSPHRFSTAYSYAVKSPLASIHFAEYYSFLYYSAETWGFHFREAKILDYDDDDADIVRFVIKICDTGSKSYSAWSRLYWRARVTIRTERPEYPENLTDLMAASYDGHHGVVKALLRSGAEIDRKDTMGWTALSRAIEKGHYAIVHASFTSRSEGRLPV